MNTKYFVLNKMQRASFVLMLIGTLIISTGALAAGGTLDPAFGTNGIVVTDLGGPSDTGANIVLQPDGKIIVAGSAELDSNFPGFRTPVIVRYNSDGTLDSTFGSGGKVIATISGPARMLATTRS